MIIEVVRFDGDWVALVKEQNELNGNFTSCLRQIQGAYGEEYIRYAGRSIKIHSILQKAIQQEDELRDLYKLRFANCKNK